MCTWSLKKLEHVFIVLFLYNSKQINRWKYKWLISCLFRKYSYNLALVPMALIKRIQNVTQWSLNYQCIIFQTLHCVTCVSNHVVCCAKNISECQILFPPLTSVYPGVPTCVHLPPADSGTGESKTNSDSAEYKREVLPMAISLTKV